MNRTKKVFSGGALTRMILIRFFGMSVIYTMALAFAWMFAVYFFSRFVWYGDELVYRLLSPIRRHETAFLLLSWLVGILLIFLYYWRKTLGFVDTIAQAAGRLVDSSEDLIVLPPELKQVEMQMNQVKQTAVRNDRLAKEAEQRKNDLIIYLAHDLKTPLTSVIGYLTLLRDEPQISEELRRKYLAVSLDKAERLEELINEFFEITRFNLSHLTLEPSRLNLTRMLEQIVYEFRPLFATKNLQCTLHAEPDIEIRCDVDKMERVFDNLIRNAVNYSFEDSTIEISAVKEPGGVQLCFANRGNTIPKEKLARIFEQFYRLDNSRSTKTGGAGLGLAIAKEIVELHHGTITASSEAERIAFTVFLPEQL